METFGRERKNLSLKKKNPNRIKVSGKSIEIEPKFFSKRVVMRIKEGWLLEKAKREIIPAIISPKEKIE